MDTLLQQISNKFYRLEVNVAVQELNQFVEQFEEFLSEFASKQQVPPEQIQGLNQLLEIIMECLQNRDYILAADLIHYEFTAQFVALKEIEHQG